MKREIIEFIKTHKKTKYLVGYVGDGTNDSEALQAADVSIALGEFDISIAAPFVSKVKNISCVVALMCEGRANLVNGFHNFRFFIFFTFCQFTGLLQLLFFYISWNAAQLIWMDLIMLTAFGYLISSFRPSKLSPHIPKSSLFNKRFLISLSLQILASLVIMIIGYNYMRKNSSFYEYPVDKFSEHEKQTGHIDMNRDYSDNHLMFMMVNNLFLIYFFITSIRSRFRESLTRKPLTILYMIIMMGMNIFWLGLANSHSELDMFINHWFYIPAMPGAVHFVSILLVINSVLTIVIELAVEYVDRKNSKHKLQERQDKCRFFKFVNLI